MRQNKQWTRLHSAIDRGYDETAKKLIKSGNHVNTMSPSGLIPLHLAIQRNRVSVVQLLIKKEVNLHAKDPNGKSAVSFTGYNDEIIAILLKAGADPFVKMLSIIAGKVFNLIVAERIERKTAFLIADHTQTFMNRLHFDLNVISIIFSYIPHRF